MLIGELSERTGVAPATIKYYVREGLLPAGERLGGNRTDYSGAHEQRLRLVRAMLEIGKLSVASVRDVLAALDEPGAPIAATFDVAQQALSRAAVPDVSEPTAASLARIDALAARAGWGECDDNIGRDIAARVLDGFERAGFPLPDTYLDRYADAALVEAEADLGAVAALPDRSRMTELMVVGTILGDPLALGLRRIAQAVVTSRRSMP